MDRGPRPTGRRRQVARPVYKGVVFGINVNGVFLFATNRAGTIDVFGHTYKPVTTNGRFRDPAIPPGYALFGIQNIRQP